MFNETEKWAMGAIIVAFLVILVVLATGEVPERIVEPRYNVERNGSYLVYTYDHQDLKLTTTWTKFPKYATVYYTWREAKEDAIKFDAMVVRVDGGEK